MEKDMATKILVVIHSLYGHIQHMAEAVAEGARGVEDVEVTIKRIPETLSAEILEKMGATASQQNLAALPVAQPEDLKEADGIIFGTPTRFGNMSAQMRTFLDATGQLWANGDLIGKVGGVFTSTATQHGGQETTIASFHTTLLHHGMIIAGLPYAYQGQTGIDEVNGGTPYGASTIAGGSGERMPSETELNGAKFQGKFIAEIAKKLNAN